MKDFQGGSKYSVTPELIRHSIDLDGEFFLNETALLLLGLIEAIRLHLFINFIEICQMEK